MPIEKRSAINEVLIRFDERGHFQGAHQVVADWDVDADTGAVDLTRAPSFREAEPLEKAALKGVLTAAQVGDANAMTALRKENDRLAAEVEKLKANLVRAGEAAAQAMNQMLAEGRGIAAENTALREEIAALRRDLARAVQSDAA